MGPTWKLLLPLALVVALLGSVGGLLLTAGAQDPAPRPRVELTGTPSEPTTPAPTAATPTTATPTTAGEPTSAEPTPRAPATTRAPAPSGSVAVITPRPGLQGDDDDDDRDDDRDDRDDDRDDRDDDGDRENDRDDDD